MKKQKNSTVEVHSMKAQDQGYVDHIKKRHREEGIKLADERAKEDAGKNLPQPKSKSRALLMFLTAFYNVLLADYKSHAQNSLQNYHAGKDVEEHKRKINGLQEKLNQVINGLRIKRRSIENFKSHQDEMTQYYKAMTGILLLTTSEMIFAASSFQIFSENLLFSLVIGFSFAVCMYYASVVSARLLKNAKNRVQFIGISIAIIAVLSSVFYSLGLLRVQFITEMSDGMETELNPLVFLMIQLFFFITSIFLKYFYTPDKIIFDKHREYKKAEKDIVQLTTDQKTIEGSIEKQELILKDSLIGRKMLVEYSADVERQIITMYHEAYQHYLKQNIHLRTDNTIPVLFETENILPSLTLYFQDEKLLDFNE